MAKQTSGQASQSQKTSESQKTAKKTEHVLEQTPKSLLIGTGMTLLGGAMWGMNSTVAKLLMRSHQLRSGVFFQSNLHPINRML